MVPTHSVPLPSPRHNRPFAARAFLFALAALVPVLSAPAEAAGQEEEGDTVPAYRARMAESLAMNRGVILTRSDLESLGARNVGRAVDQVSPGPFRTRSGTRCTPVVYWNGMRMPEAWDRQRSVAAEVSLSRVDAMEIYFADKDGGLPSEYLQHDCGVIALWIPNQDDGIPGSTLVRLGLIVAAALAFFFAVGH